MLEPPDKDLYPDEGYLCWFLTERCKDLEKLRKEVHNCQDAEISIGNFKYSRESVLSKIQQLIKNQNDSRISATSMDILTLATNARNSIDHLCAQAENSHVEAAVVSSLEEASLVPPEAGAGDMSMANYDGCSSLLQLFDSTTQPRYDVLISRVEALPGSFRRRNSFDTAREFEICAKFSNHNIEVFGQDQVFCPELTVCLSLTWGRLAPNRITCRLIDTGEVIKDYLQDANQLASEAKFIVQVSRCDSELQFENFSLIKICHPDVACTMERESNYKFKYRGQYLFKSVSLEVSDSVFIDYVSSSSEKMNVEVRIQRVEPTTTPTVVFQDVGPFDHHFNSVFENELLLGKIMKYATRYDRRLDSYFAVNKMWRKSACNEIVSYKFHDYHIEDIEKIVYFTPGGFPLGNVKPYTLTVQGNENASPAVLKFLRRYPPSQFDFIYPQPPHPTQGDQLNKVLFETIKDTIGLAIYQSDDDEKNIPVQNLQRILDIFRNCKRLFMQLDFNYEAEPTEELDRSNLKLPALLESLTWRTSLDSFPPLMRNECRLSKLKCLRLLIGSNILDESTDQLMELPSNINRLIRRMPLLKVLGIATPSYFETTVDVPNCLELRRFDVSGCGLILPSAMEHLEYFNLEKVKPNLVRDAFAEGRQFPKLSELCLHCIDLMNAGFVDRLADGVPNCTILRTTLNIDSGSAALFTQLFLRLKKLTTLDLRLRVEDADYCSPSHIASYFSGLTLNEVRRIQALPDGPTFQEADLDGITCLKDLRQLIMTTYYQEHHIPLPELLFRLTFLRMSYLQAIVVDSCYDIADGVIEQWTSLGREFELLDLRQEISQSIDDDESGDDGDIHDNDDSGDDGDIHDNNDSGDDGDIHDNDDSGDNGDIHDNDDSGDDGDIHHNDESFEERVIINNHENDLNEQGD